MSNKSERKKELILEYKSRKISGGVYKITNTANGWYWLKADLNIQGQKNRFEFSKKTNSCVLLRLKKDWDQYGSQAFTFEILEEIEMKDTQTLKEFKDDLLVLEEMWAERFDAEKSYLSLKKKI
ncbi:GIY-YIG nuclease family protein [Candidatus Contubernalis alkaliaceticus]|uniref:GIY-YIG nuclease family protein n=1 Tax=Candidatus Contubernalis alkaliaceticus TaxID=338645 RepID=UPI001F4C3E6E|nr:GIY-YIG nuclease family protein [Candidatus Contubernalis alkalaceticus]UNC91333.1 GIY-YIG nuclease family protein [Candidatus Contubernalis alkalaceticus]